VPVPPLLALAPDRASYLSDMLPGFLLLGAGVGLVFVAVTVTAMADVGHEEAGLASGIMTTAHELGAALGVAILAAIATSNGNPVSGYGNAFFVAAAMAALLAIAAALVLPALRPAPGTHVSMH
jgi:predicted MFS family arabinose efflux permease